MKKIFSLLMVSLMALSLSAEKVYFVNTPGWANVKVYAWGGSGTAMDWPGVDAVKLEDKINDFDVYEFSADPGSYANCIFNNGAGTQTKDLDWNAGKYFYNDAWYAKEDIPAVVPPVDPGENMTVHFVNKAGWEVVNAFVWPATGDAYKVWPGEAMTKEAEKINDFDVFEYTFPALHVNIIFNNGKDQTDDLVWDAAKPYFYDGKWYAKEDIPAVEPPVDPGENMTVHFVNKAGWEVVNAFVWPAEGDAYKAWPGEAMTKEAEKINDFDVYSYTFPATNINIIFNNGTNQTVNLVWDAAKLYFVINAAAASSESQFEGQWYAKEDIPAVEPEVPNGFYLVGTFNDWKPSAEYAFAPNPELAPGEEYMLTVDLQTGDELKGLVVLMGEWYYYPDGDNIVVTEEYAGNCTIYFRPLGNPEWPMKYIYIQRNHGQGIEETLSEGKAVKVLYEGKLLIMKGSHSYTPMGQIVK